MGADEEGTHERLKAHRRELIDPKIREHQGRIVKTTGDGMLVEFPSVVDAVRCAVEVQRGMIDRNAGTSSEQRVEFRVGINLGDVIVDGEDIFGDGVNIAARLEALAQPGGICVSRTVRDHIRDRLPYSFADLGEQSLKNIARPVRAYAVHPQPAPGQPAVSAPPAASISPPAATPRLSIVVLPFVNLSSDPEQGYFADGITEDLTTDLSRIAGMFVISRNTAFTYRDKLIDTKQIGRELGIRYVLEGSVRRSGNQLRVNAQLIDAETDAHLWAERFDHHSGDLFGLQNEITGRIANTLNLELLGAEMARPADNPDALDYILRGRAASAKPQSREKYAEEIGLYERALALDPRSLEAQIRLATALVSRVLDEMTDSAAADIARAEPLIGQVLAASPRNPLAHYAKGQLLRTQRRCEAAILEYEAALASNRNWAGALSHIARCKTYIGLMEEAIALQEQAIRLNPREPSIGVYYYRIGEAYLLQSRTDEAIAWLEKARDTMPGHPATQRFLASAYALKGEIGRAAATLAEARRLNPDDRYSSIARLRADRSQLAPKAVALYESTYLAGLRKAGVPEE
jgi:adenylate cyclase